MTDEELAVHIENVRTSIGVEGWIEEEERASASLDAIGAEVQRLKEECAQVSISYDVDVADLPLMSKLESLAVPMTRVRIVAKRSDGWHGCEPICPVRMVHADTEAQVLHMLDSASVTGP